jgi:hypothetical protein
MCRVDEMLSFMGSHMKRALTIEVQKAAPKIELFTTLRKVLYRVKDNEVTR